MTVKGGTSQACAACKYQRRKCSSDCQLAPYFPPDQPKQFQNAHKLFGVSNILKILKNLDANQKVEAMRSIIYESNVRDRYPVHGCLGLIQTLHYQIHQTQQELEIVNAQLAIYTQQLHHHVKMEQSPPSSQLQLGTAAENNNSLSLYHLHHHHQQQQQLNVQHFNTTMSCLVPGFEDNNPATNNNNNNLWLQQPSLSHGHLYNNGGVMGIQQQQFAPQEVVSCQQQEAYDEISPFFDTIDDRQSYIGSKEAYDSSPESSLKDNTQLVEQVGENELKSAAACFTLTSVN